MKIISLNAWGGRVSNIKQFIIDQSKDTDIFCFQESYNDKLEIFCQKWLPNYQLFFDNKVMSDEDEFHQATFIKKNLQVIKTQTIGLDDIETGIGLYTQIKIGNTTINICNVHGCAYPGDKQDNPKRLRQSQLIIDFFQKLTGPKIIMGDFNLDFGVKSVLMFEEAGFKNLIKEFNITNTRNELSWRKFPDNKQHFADFSFISQDIKITNFSVPYNEVSDHLPLILEFEI
jgi:endonuclease/exonuclease/phosphatase family metal-dependent hydrolase